MEDYKIFITVGFVLETLSFIAGLPLSFLGGGLVGLGLARYAPNSLKLRK